MKKYRHLLREIEVEAGKYADVLASGTSVSIAEIVGPAELRMQLESDTFQPIEEGMTLSVDEAFKSLRFHNPSATLARAKIRILTGSISDNRFKASGTVTVDDGAGTSFGDVVAALDPFEAQKSAAIYHADGAVLAAGVHDLIAAAANVNGVKIYYGAATISGVDDAWLLIGGRRAAGTGQNSQGPVLRNLFVPAGEAVQAQFTAATGEVYVMAEVI